VAFSWFRVGGLRSALAVADTLRLPGASRLRETDLPSWQARSRPRAGELWHRAAGGSEGGVRAGPHRGGGARGAAAALRLGLGAVASLLEGRFDWDSPIPRPFLSRNIEAERPLRWPALSRAHHRPGRSRGARSGRAANRWTSALVRAARADRTNIIDSMSPPPHARFCVFLFVFAGPTLDRRAGSPGAAGEAAAQLRVLLHLGGRCCEVRSGVGGGPVVLAALPSAPCCYYLGGRASNHGPQPPNIVAFACATEDREGGGQPQQPRVAAARGGGRRCTGAPEKVSENGWRRPPLSI
jgi:hypothetical protein